MKILFVRHGKTSWNSQKKIQGSVDIPLSTEGIEHAEKMAKKLENMNIDVAFCSKLTRANQTMEIINNSRKDKIPVIFEDALAERDYFLYEGRNKNLFDYNFVWNYSNPLNTENFFKFAWPILHFVFGKLMRAYKDKTVLIVSHGGVSKIFEMLFSKNSLYPDELASYLPNNSEIITYQNINKSDFLFNINENDEIRKRDNEMFFKIITPNIISLYFPEMNVEDLIDVKKISKFPKIRYRAAIIFQKEDGNIAVEEYSNTKECKLPARTIEPNRNILHQVREVMLQMTGYLGDISDFYNIGETMEIRPSDPVAEIVVTQVYYISKAILVAEPLPDSKDEMEGFKIGFYHPDEAIKLMNKSLKEAKGLEGEFYRPSITKKSIALRDKFILELWSNNLK